MFSHKGNRVITITVKYYLSGKKHKWKREKPSGEPVTSRLTYELQ
jgi:hypothetical protein